MKLTRPLKLTPYSFILAATCSIYNISALEGQAYADGKGFKVIPAGAADIAKVDLLNERSRSYKQTNLDSVLYYAKAAKNLAEKINYKFGVAEGLINLTAYYQSRGNFTEAMKSDLQALSIYEAVNAVAQKGFGYLMLAQIYKDLSGDKNTEEYIDKGIDYSKIANGLYRTVNDTAGMANSLNMAGILYRDKGKLFGKRNYYDTAFAGYTLAISLIRKSGKGTDYLGKLYNNISQVYLEHKKDYKKGLEYLYKAVDYNEKHNNLLSLSHNYGNVSYAYTQLKDDKKAVEYARKMLDAAVNAKRPSRIYDAYYQLYAAFNAAGTSDSALRYYILSSTLNDSLTNLSRSAQVLDLQYKYETEKKELHIQGLNAENRAKNKEIVLLIVSLTIVSALAIGLILLYRRLQFQKKQLNDQSKRLEVMMKELHHRVKNNLQIVSSLLSLQTHKADDEEVVSVLRESQQRVQAMSLIHQRLYAKDELTTINLKEYITDLIDSLMSSFGYKNDNFQLRVNISKEMLEIDKALPIGLILNEIVTNSFKYAYKNIAHPVLYITFNEDNKSLFLTVKDNGVGLDQAQWKQKNGSFGKQLIEALCRQLRAKQSVVVDGGTEFLLTIPKKVA